MARKSRRNKNDPQAAVQEPVIINKKENLMATGAYARLSVENETDDTIKTQVAMLHSYIANHPELELTDTYIDNGYSGTNFDRPEFIRLMDDVRSGRIHCIVVKDECAIIGLTRKKLINTGFSGDVLFLLTLKIADKALRRRQYAQNRYLSAKRRITGSGGCDFGHTLQTDIHGRRHDQYSFAVDLCRRSVWHSSNVPVACAA